MHTMDPRHDSTKQLRSSFGAGLPTLATSPAFGFGSSQRSAVLKVRVLLAMWPERAATRAVCFAGGMATDMHEMRPPRGSEAGHMKTPRWRPQTQQWATI